MTMIRTITRGALSGYLRLVRLPLHGVLRLSRANGSGDSVSLCIDRLDASVRAVVGQLLNDPVLAEDAERRSAAAGKRARALHLRESAEEAEQQADREAEKREAEARRTREQASKRAKRLRGEADEKRLQGKRRAAKTSKQRKDSAQARATQAEKAVEEKRKRARLEELASKSEALQESAEALTTADGAHRLKEAAATAKAERKS